MITRLKREAEIEYYNTIGRRLADTFSLFVSEEILRLTDEPTGRYAFGMKRRIVISAIGCFAAGVVFLVGFGIGLERGQLQASLQEAKVARAALMLDSGDFTLEPQLREYLKGRIYYVVGRRLRHHPGYISQRAWDVGTVDMGVLKRPIFAKDPSFTPLTYGEAIAGDVGISDGKK